MGISTHVLNTSLGRPAAGIAVALDRMAAGGWDPVAHDNTDTDGRAALLLPRKQAADPGIYRLRFATGAYFATLGAATLFPEIQVHFEVRAGELHYHLPLLLTPHSYTTYRGS